MPLNTLERDKIVEIAITLVSGGNDCLVSGEVTLSCSSWCVVVVSPATLQSEYEGNLECLSLETDS